VTQNSLPPQQSLETGSPSFNRPSFRQRLKRFPATFSLIGITILIYIAQEISVYMYGFDLVATLGAKINAAIFAGELWRFITPIFIHAGIWHIFVNMYSLYAIGPGVEGFFGTQRMLVIYFFSGISSVIFSLAFSSYASVGASGAIFGLLGCFGAFLFIHRKSLGHSGRTYLRQVVLIALLNLALGLAPNIDNWGHVGGFLAGIALAWFLGPRFELRWRGINEPPEMVKLRPWTEVWPRAIPAAAVLVFLAYLAFLSPFGK
jgi:rhomboid protease GluP